MAEDNCRNGLTRIEDYIKEGQGSLREYKKEIELLKQEISLMENHLATQNDENVKVLNPAIVDNFSALGKQIAEQRILNEHLQNQLVDLKRDKSVVQQCIF